MAQKLLQPIGALEWDLSLGRIRRLWNGSELITTNRGAGGEMGAGKKVKLNKSLSKQRL